MPDVDEARCRYDDVAGGEPAAPTRLASLPAVA